MSISAFGPIASASSPDPHPPGSDPLSPYDAHSHGVLAAPASKPPHSAPPKASQLVRVRVVTDVEAIRPGALFHVALIFDIAPHWHIYWEDSGDAGAPTDIAVTAPEGFVVGKTQFPRPKAFSESEGTTFGYERQTVLFVPMRAPAALDDGHVTFDIDAFYLVCQDVCLLGETKQSVRVATTATPATTDPGVRTTPSLAHLDTKTASLLERYRKRLPRSFKALGGAEARYERRRLTVTTPHHGHDEITLFPLPAPGVTFGTVKVRKDRERFYITAPISVEPQNALGERMAIRFVLALGSRLDDPCYHWVQMLPDPDTKPSSRE